MKTSMGGIIGMMVCIMHACTNVCPGDRTSEGPAAEPGFKEGLEALWRECGGDHWTTASGGKVIWDFSSDPSLWTGIREENGLWCVDFSGPGIQNVSGTIPEIFWHRDIKKINFSGCRGLTGTLRERFYEMVSLEYLNLSDTGIGGTLSGGIGRLKKLRMLNLDNCSFEGTIPEEIGTLDLYWCSMQGNFFDSFPEFFRYRPTYHGYWDCGRGTDYPCIQRDRESGEMIFIPMPYWMAVKFNKEESARQSGYPGVFWMLAGTHYPDYPDALDLQFRACEYYFDGHDWRHHRYIHPARDYWYNGSEWVYEPGNPWVREIDTGEYFDSEGKYHFR